MQTKRTMASVGFGFADMLKVVKRNIIHSTSTTMNGVENESGGLGQQTETGLLDVRADLQRARMERHLGGRLRLQVAHHGKGGRVMLGTAGNRPAGRERIVA